MPPVPIATRCAFRVLLCAASVAAWFCAGAVVARGEGLSPAAALAQFKVAPGFRVQLFASEPEIRQPVAMSFDGRGRMWVIQYLQYPTPAGLTAVQVDQYLRTKYDRVPDPPPRGPRGADRITILEDTDGDGHADSSKDFVSGLNLTTGLAIGHGGVFVVQAPYLLFYADRDGDDVPDGDPEVLLTGFGLEDAPRTGQQPAMGTRRLAVRCPGKHRHGAHPRRDFPARDLAISPADPRFRAIRRRGR